MKNKFNKKGAVAITQILILIIGIVAIGWEIGIVSGFTDKEIYFVNGKEYRYDGQTNKFALKTTEGNWDVTNGVDASVLGLEGMGGAGKLNPGAAILPTQGVTITSSYDVGQSVMYNLQGKNTLGTITSVNSGKYTINVPGLNGAASTTVSNLEVEQITGLSKVTSGYDSTLLSKAGYTDLYRSGNNIIGVKDGVATTISDPNTVGIKDVNKISTSASAAATGTKTYFGIIPATQGGVWSAVLSGLQWAAVVGAIVGIITMFLPEKYKGIGTAATYGLTAAAASYGFLSEWKTTAGNTGWNLGISAAIGIGIFLMMYKTTKTEIISFQCKSWDAPTKGSDCEKCNKQELPCSEYQCRSLGQACALVNDKSNGEQMCVWQDIRDANPPEIKEWSEALLKGYEYKPATAISPPDRGTKIIYTNSSNGCVPAFTPLSFGIETNEPAKCKLDYVRKKTFDDMQFFFGGSSTFKYNHTQVMSLPGPSASENVTIQNNGNFEIYTRCMDANGNANVATFVFQFCVDKGPDMTPPTIVTTNLLNNMPISFGTNSTDIIVYTNEPATCKWTHDKDKDYDKMENDMQCSSSVFEMNAQMLYTCKTKLTGLENMKENVFYFKCKDQPLAAEGDRNSMTEGYKFTLIGTQPLVIDEVKPINETIKGATDSIKVTLEAKTSAGFNRGESTCYYSKTGKDDDYQMFFYDTSNNMNHEHKQDLYLVSGNYKYYIRCIDLGGNYDVKKVNFSVETDTTAPIVVRAYHIGTYLEMITNENAKCVYDIKDCNYNFADGTPINRVEEKNVHYLDWDNEKTYYVKCEDEFGNQPAPNQCSIIVRAFENFEGKKE